MQRTAITGVGLGLRWEFIEDVLEAQPHQLAAVRFFEISPENYMRRGGYFPAALMRVAERHPITTHGLTLSLGGAGAFDATYFAELRRLLDRLGTDWHSDHLSFSGLEGAHLHDLLPLPLTLASATRVAERTREAAERLRRPMLVENISYYVTLGASELDEPAFIAEVLDRAQCGLLLDLNNLDVNARNHGFDALQWLRAIPLDRVAEIHVAGPEPLPNGLLVDTHGAPVRPSVYELLDWVIERTGPLPVLLERDNNVPPLAELLQEQAQIDAVYQAALLRWQARGEASRAA